MQHDSILLLLINDVTTYQLPKSETSSLHLRNIHRDPLFVPLLGIQWIIRQARPLWHRIYRLVDVFLITYPFLTSDMILSVIGCTDYVFYIALPSVLSWRHQLLNKLNPTATALVQVFVISWIVMRAS